MRVRISYGMEIEDIPADVERRGLIAILELQNTVEQLSTAISLITDADEDYKIVLSMLEKVRLKLTSADLVITDLQAILEGLHKYYEGGNNVSEGRSTMDPSGNPIATPEGSREG